MKELRKTLTVKEAEVLVGVAAIMKRSYDTQCDGAIFIYDELRVDLDLKVFSVPFGTEIERYYALIGFAVSCEFDYEEIIPALQ